MDFDLFEEPLKCKSFQSMANEPPFFRGALRRVKNSQVSEIMPTMVRAIDLEPENSLLEKYLTLNRLN